MSCLDEGIIGPCRAVAVRKTASLPLAYANDGVALAYALSANSVGVLPVTWRKAWEKAGTLA